MAWPRLLGERGGTGLVPGLPHAGSPRSAIPPEGGIGGSCRKAILMQSFFTCFPISLIEFGLLKSGH